MNELSATIINTWAVAVCCRLCFYKRLHNIGAKYPHYNYGESSFSLCTPPSVMVLVYSESRRIVCNSYVSGSAFVCSMINIACFRCVTLDCG